MDKRLEKLLAWGLLIIFAGIVVHTPLSLWLGAMLPEYSLLLKAWKEILMFLLVPVAATLVTRRKLWPEFSKDLLFRLIIVYAVLHFVLLGVFGHQFAQLIAGLGIDLRYLLFFALVYTLLRVAPGYKDLMVKIVIGGAAVIVGFATLQLFLPADILAHIGYNDQTIQPFQTVDDNANYVRVNSTLRGPNPLGAYAAAAITIVVAFMMVQKKRLKERKILVASCLLLVASFVALWQSYSRSSIVAAIIGVSVVVFMASVKKISRTVWIATVIVVTLVVASLFIGRDSNFVQNVILHDDPITGASVTSNDNHAASLQNGLNQSLRQPFGAGIGSTGSASLLGENGQIVENQYLFIAHETGWLGLALYICIFVIVMWRLFVWRTGWLALGVFAGGITLGLIGLLLPVWADDTVSIVWWGLAALVIGGKHGRQSSK